MITFIMNVLFLFLNIVRYTIYLILLLVTGAFIRLIFSRKKYEQQKIDIGKLRKGDVILTGSNRNLDSWHIKISNLLTNGLDSKFWTHTALHIDDGKLIEAQPKGIVYNSINEYLDKGLLVKVYRHRYISDPDDTLNKILNFCEEAKKENYKYGWIGLGFYVLASFLPVSANFLFSNKRIDEWCNLDKAYFCSELVADAYRDAEYKIAPFDSWRIKPSDFIKNPFFEEIKFSK